MKILLLFLVTACGLLGAPARDGLILVEAECFAHRGGWVVDPQFMDTMGS
jgi:hypothetical protein